MDISALSESNVNELHQLVLSSYRDPAETPSKIESQISRNRALNSSVRRNMLDLVHVLIRWRKRFWGDIPPSKIDLKVLEDKIAEINEILENPPLRAWSKLSLDKLSYQLSYPRWILNAWISQFGLEPAVSIALAQNIPAAVHLRSNGLKTDRGSLLEFFRREKIDASALNFSPWGIKLNQRANLVGSRAYRNGWFEVQDEGSQLCVLKTNVQAGDRVFDACARTGGKSLALAALMENKGEIVASDIDARTLEKLKIRARRAGASIIRTEGVNADDRQPLAQYKASFDTVLVDAPCSALGTLRRNSSLKWILSQHAVDELPQLQLSILSRYALHTKPSGSLMYVTCAINENENESVIKRFLAQHRFFELKQSGYFLPNVEGTDGFFYAQMKREPAA